MKPSKFLISTAALALLGSIGLAGAQTYGQQKGSTASSPESQTETPPAPGAGSPGIQAPSSDAATEKAAPAPSDTGSKSGSRPSDMSSGSMSGERPAKSDRN